MKDENGKRKDRKWSFGLEVFSVLFAFALSYFFLTPDAAGGGGDTVINNTTIWNIDGNLVAILEWAGIGFLVLVALKILSVIADALDIFDIFDIF
ncbi:hypothetical protein [Lewinella sp. LCG006]|uniref:hypothetical protein n=1 Tax=Lewinella sp. LCG006 TaxID=3231911 RepID=UPI0034604F9D